MTLIVRSDGLCVCVSKCLFSLFSYALRISKYKKHTKKIMYFWRCAQRLLDVHFVRLTISIWDAAKKICLFASKIAQTAIHIFSKSIQSSIVDIANRLDKLVIVLPMNIGRTKKNPNQVQMSCRGHDHYNKISCYTHGWCDTAGYRLQTIQSLKLHVCQYGAKPTHSSSDSNDGFILVNYQTKMRNNK